MGNLDLTDFLKAYGIDQDTLTKSKNDENEIINSKCSAGDLELKNMGHGFAGQTCYTPQHWKETTTGRHPLINYRQVLGTSALKPVHFSNTNDERLSAGVKTLELGRVIALPGAGALLAALGADVITIQSPKLTNFGMRLCDL
jgi:hypothetical protein